MKHVRRLLSPAVGRRAGRQQPAAGKNNHGGFTIVETLIVMAIAGLILLIVLEALPALSRNSRNNQRKQDVQIILSAVSHYALNDSGNFPADCNGSPNACTDAGGPTVNDYFLQYVKSRLTFYTGSTQIVLAQQPDNGSTSFAGSTDLDTVYIYNYQKCNPNGGGSTWQGAGYTDVVALYALESGNNASSATSQCQQL